MSRIRAAMGMKVATTNIMARLTQAIPILIQVTRAMDIAVTGRVILVTCGRVATVECGQAVDFHLADPAGCHFKSDY